MPPPTAPSPGSPPPPVYVPASAPLVAQQPIVVQGGVPLAAPAPSRRWPAELLRLLLGVPVVAAGALVALLVSGERDERAAEIRRDRLSEALRAELFEAQLGVAAVRATLDDHLSAAGQGALPDPPPAPRIAQALAVPYLWRAVLPSGALDLLDATTLRRLAAFHGRLDAFDAELRAAVPPGARLAAVRDSAAALEATADSLVRELRR